MIVSREKKTYCPECDGAITFKRTPWLGEKTTCRHCDTSLEVVDTNPIELDWAFDEDNDYADYEFDKDTA